VHYSTFLIDLDHTLFDSDASESAALRQAMQAAGITEPDGHADDFRRINLAMWSKVERGEMAPQQVRMLRFEVLVEQAGLDADPHIMADAYVLGLGANGELYSGALDVLDHLRRHASLALLTNGLSDVQRNRIERTGVADYFDAIVISAEVGISKPHTGIFDIAFEQLGSPGKESAVMVGDSLSSDIQGGTNYGIATCWYNPHRKQAGPGNTISHEIHALNELHAHYWQRVKVTVP
jgi:YjjG family noncanonical pyrimidine nucleotidase